MVASAGTNELFVAAALFVIVGTGVAAAVAGLPMALGAFIAGLLLAETEFRKAIETTIGPFKGLLLGLFFFTVGMSLDFRELTRQPLLLFVSVVGLIGIKFILLTGLARIFRTPWSAAIETGLLLGPGGEFAFVGISMATTLGLIDANLSSFTLAVTSITMVLIPVLSHFAQQLAPKFKEPKALDHELAIAPSGGKGHAIVIGYGRVGQVVCSMLDRHSLVVSPLTMTRLPFRTSSEMVVRSYGDARNSDFLGLRASRGRPSSSRFRGSRDRRSGTTGSRAENRRHYRLTCARHHPRAPSYAIRVTDAVPETIEASLQLSEATLIGLGLATGWSLPQSMENATISA